MVKNFDDINVDFYFNNEKVDCKSKMYNDAIAVINAVAEKMWDSKEHLQNWTEELGINYCGSLVDIIDCHVFVYLCNCLASQCHVGFFFSDASIAVVEGGIYGQDHWMIDLNC